MDKKQAKEPFATLKIKVSVVKRFRSFCRTISMSQSMGLMAMLDFFRIHELSPMDSIDGNLKSMEIRIKRRISNAIAIIRSIEKSQTLPTTAILQSLFEQEIGKDGDPDDLEDDLEFVEKKFVDTVDSEAWMEETTIPRIRYERLEEQLERLREDFGYVMGRVIPVKNSFGKGYLKLDVTPEELEKYKRIHKIP